MRLLISMLMTTTSVFLSQAYAGLKIEAMNADSAILEESANKDQRISYFFGNVNLNSSSWAAWVITNTGTEAIQIVKATLSGVMYAGSTSCKKILQPNDKCRVDVRFSPFTEGYHNADLALIFDKGGNIYYSFWGYGVR